MSDAWNPVWEDVHKTRFKGSYPDEAMIRYTARCFYAVEPRSSVKVLDMGCGQGASTWYLCREGFDVTGIDGSAAAIEAAKAWLGRDGLKAKLDVGDVVKLPYATESFDYVADLYCFMCMPHEVAAKAVSEAHRVLKPGGKFLSITARQGCWGDGIGQQVGPHTFANANDGPFAGMGMTRFLPQHDIPRLYSPFANLQVEAIERTTGGLAHRVSFWVVGATKP